MIGSEGRLPRTETHAALPRVYFIRHGETAWSLSRQHTGRTDIALNEQGEQDARMLAAPLGAVDFSRVFSSPLRRARRTCELAGLGEVAETEPDLTEWDYGDYEGLRPIEIRQRRPGWNVFRDGCPGGESPSQISQRRHSCNGRVRPSNPPVRRIKRGASLNSDHQRQLPAVPGQVVTLPPFSS